MGLHGQQNMEKHHTQKQKHSLLNKSKKYIVFHPATYVHQVNHGLRMVKRVNQKVYPCVEQGD